jgi:predicted  nucleic acid-binding Zn-ribbon protein
VTPLSGADLEALLAVQALDTARDRARHRRATLAERDEMIAIDAQLASGERQLSAARAARDAVTEREQSLEHTLTAVERRASEVKKRLYGGTVSATRELQAMAAELDSLTARASDLESQALAVMEEGEPLDARVEALEGEKASLIAARAVVEARLARRETEVDDELDVLNDARAQAVGPVPLGLLATYEDLRHRLGGTGVARLVGSRCGGCHLTLPATELDRLRRQVPGNVTFCEQCERILVPAQAL